MTPALPAGRGVGDASPPAPPPFPLDVRLHHALADELVGLTRVMADLAYDLGTNPATLRAHMASLQEIDRLTQTQLAIAEILRSDEPVEARVAGITLESLAQQLGRTLGLEVAPRDDNRVF